MPKQLNLSLNVTANTEKARVQLQALQDQLTKVVNAKVAPTDELAKPIHEASKAAAELQAHLQNATTDLGTLDYSKFTQSLSRSGKSVTDYAQKLLGVGAAGEKAFQQLATSIASSEVPLKRTNKMLNEMWVSLKNSFRWKISSSFINGLTGALQGAYNYAQNLNESLNDIRIVTGKSVEEMEAFAASANKAAKELSATTNTYAKGSLIYYQMGLSDAEVKERTDVTIKMANVVKQSAETVSNQMTAIWNNFDNGTKPLEYYADVLTKLGAATASSTDEIAGGLEKFASVANTIGLSYEYATSALATITAKTRQSENVVGTALRSIFARLQGLQLGETLEDGTTLNKYSAALAKVGVNILDANHNLKDMDTLLDELGTRWKTLSKDEGVALAQTVAGVRQYTQLVSLMENYDYFKENVGVARGATGELNKQQEIYAEGWEAASKRVRAALESIYETLLDDEAFITLLNVFESLITYTDRFIDSIGGLQGVFLGLGSIATKVFSKQIAESLRDGAYTISNLFGGKDKIVQDRTKNIQQLTDMASQQVQFRGKSEDETAAWAKGISNINALNIAYSEKKDYLPNDVRAVAEANIQAQERLEAEREQAVKDAAEARARRNRTYAGWQQRAGMGPGAATDQATPSIEEQRIKRQAIEDAVNADEAQFTQIYSLLDTMEHSNDDITDEQKNILGQALKAFGIDSDSFSIERVDKIIDTDDLKSLKAAFVTSMKQKIKATVMSQGIVEDDVTDEKLQNVIDVMFAEMRERAANTNADEGQKSNEKFFESLTSATADWADKLTAVSSAATSLSTAFTSLTGLGDILTNDDLSNWEKFSTLLGTVSFNAINVLSSFRQVSSVFGGANGIAKGLNGLTIKLGGVKAATDAATASNAAMAASAKGTSVGLLGVAKAAGTAIIGLAPYILAAGAVIAIGYSIYKAFNKDAIAAKNAEKAYKELSKSYEETAQKYEELKNTISGYEDAKNGIDELKYGTEEFKAAIVSANDQALELIKNYDELQGKYRVENGIITFDDGALEKVKNNQFNQLTNVQNAQLLARNSLSNAKIEAAKEDIRNRTLLYGQLEAVLKAAAKDVSFFGDYENNIKSLIPNASSVEALINEKEAIEELAKQIQLNTAEQKANNDLIVQNKFGDAIQNSFTNEASRGLLTSILTEQQSALQEASYNNLLNLEESTPAYYQGIQDAVQNYAAAMGYDTDSADIKNMYGDTVTFKNKDGTEEIPVPKDVILAWTATEEASKQVSGNINTYIKQVDKAANIFEDSDKFLKVLSTTQDGKIGSLDELTEKEIGQLKDALNNQLKDLADSFGIENIETAFSEAEEAYKRSFNNFQKTLSTSVYIAFTELENTNELSNSAKMAIGNILQQAFHEGGQEGLANAQFIFQTLGNDAAEFVSIVQGMEWGTVEAEDFNNKLKEAGIDLGNASSALSIFVDWINKTAGAASAAANSDYYNKTSAIINKGVKMGGVLTDEEYQALKADAALGSIANNFTYDRTGQWIFTGSASDVDAAHKMANAEFDKRFFDSAQRENEAANRYDQIANTWTSEQFGNSGLILTNKNLQNDLLNYLDDFVYDSLEKQEQGKYGNYEELLNSSNPISRANAARYFADLYNNNVSAFGGLEGAAEAKRLEVEKNLSAYYSGATSQEDLKKKRENAIAAGISGADGVYKQTSQSLSNKELIEELEITQEELDEVAQKYIEMGDSAEVAYKKAEQHIRLNKGLEELRNNWEQYQKVFNDVNTRGDGVKETQEYIQAMNNMKDILSEMSGGIFDESLFSDDFVENNLDLINQVVEGSEKALQELQIKMGNEFILNIATNINDEGARSKIMAFNAMITDFSLNNTLEIGTKINTGPIIDGMNEILKQGLMTSEEMRDYMEGMGYDIEITMEEIEVTSAFNLPTNLKEAINDDGSGISSHYGEIDSSNTVSSKGYFQYPAVKVITKTGNHGGNSKINYSNTGSSGGGGGEDKPDKIKLTKENEFYERYKELDDELDDIKDVLSDVSKMEDRLYGQNKLSAMKNQNKLLLQEVDILNDKKQAAEEYLEIDKQTLMDAAGALGYDIDFGSRDQLLNYTSTMESLFDELHAMELHYNSLPTATAQKEYKESTLQPMYDNIEDLKDAISQYDETRELLEDVQNEIDDAIYEWKANNYEQLHYVMEVRLEINDLELSQLDYFMNKLEGDFYSLAESAAYLKDKFQPVLNQLKAYGDLYEQSTAVWDSDENKKALERDITQADYVEGMFESFEGILEKLGDITEFDKQMMEYYATAIGLAEEELSKYTDSLEHLTSVLEHYQSVMDILGKTADYALMGELLEANAKVVKNELDVANSNYSMWQEQRNYWAAQLDMAQEGSEQWELYKRYLDEATKETEKAQEEVLAKTETWAKALKTILETELKEAANILENALTGGTSFDQMNTALERAESLQEEYLTDTNKIYETTKLMRQAQKDIDKATNDNTKRRLQTFITETEQLQNRKQLSEYELSIQQAKYELLLAEIALEEAQNAKSTVRLKRDFEGNFGYVYTADQEQIDDALQNLDDKRNELYNVGLEGANSYTSKYLQTLSAMYDEFTNIQNNYLNGMYESETEYQNALMDAYNYYFEQLKNYSELYSIALTADSRVVADAWSTDFQNMIYSTEDWANHAEIYIGTVIDLFEGWKETSEDLNSVIDETAGTIDEIVTSSDKLAESINDHVVPGLQEELDLLNQILKAYGLIRDSILEEQKHYEDMTENIQDDIIEEAERDDYDDVDFEREKSTGSSKKPTKPVSKPSSKPIDTGEKINVGTGAGDPGSVFDREMAKYNYDTGFRGENTIKATIAANKAGGASASEIKKDEDKLKEIEREKERIERKNSDGFATGGYTGAWGPEGRWAMLHEKELVLNKDDTENILAAVQVMRQVAQGIDQQVALQTLGRSLSPANFTRNNPTELKQNVTIEARFDNVTDRYEIEAAFDNLVNKASQYANRG